MAHMQRHPLAGQFGGDGLEHMYRNDILPVAPAPVQDPAVLLARARGDVGAGAQPPVVPVNTRNPSAMFLLPTMSHDMRSARPPEKARPPPAFSHNPEALRAHYGQIREQAFHQEPGQNNGFMDSSMMIQRQQHHQPPPQTYMPPPHNQPGLSVLEQHQQLRMQQQKKTGLFPGLSLQLVQNQHPQHNSFGDEANAPNGPFPHGRAHQDFTAVNDRMQQQPAGRRVAVHANSLQDASRMLSTGSAWMPRNGEHAPPAPEPSAARIEGSSSKGAGSRHRVGSSRSQGGEEGLSGGEKGGQLLEPGLGQGGQGKSKRKEMGMGGMAGGVVGGGGPGLQEDGKVLDADRLGQLQHFIGAAREKQERWKSRVSGGNLFKKNQEGSFIQELQRMEGDGIIVIHRGQGGEDAEQGEGGEGSVTKGAVSKEGGEGGRAGGEGGGGSEAGGEGTSEGGEEWVAKKRRAVAAAAGEGPVAAEAESHKDSEDDAKAAGEGGDGGVCPVASRNQDCHQPSLIAGWSVLSHERWEEGKRMWFTQGNLEGYKQGSFNMCLRHMGFRPTKGARYGGSGFDWDNSRGFVFDSQVRAKYTSRRSMQARPAKQT